MNPPIIQPADIREGDVLGVDRFGENGYLFEVFVMPGQRFLVVADYDSSRAIGTIEPPNNVLQGRTLYLLSRRNA